MLTVAAGLLAAHTVDGPAPGDRRRPGVHRAACAVEARRLAPDLEEDLLSDLLGMAWIVEDPLAHAIDERGELVVERAESSVVTSGDPDHQRGVVVRNAHRLPELGPPTFEKGQHLAGSAPKGARIGRPAVTVSRSWLVARCTPYGVELATAVTSGVLPGVLLATLVLPSAPTSPLGGWSTESITYT